MFIEDFAFSLSGTSVQGWLAVPKFTDPSGKSDFNDLAQAEGLDAVRLQLDAVTKAPSEPTICGLKLDDFRAGRFLNVPPEPLEWVFRDSLLTSTIGFIAGAPGVGKSLLLLQIGCAVATGESKFIGEKYYIDAPGRVLLICPEEDERILARRLHAIKRKFINPEEIGEDRAARLLQLLDERLIILPLAGKDLRLIQKEGGNLVKSAVFEEIAVAIHGMEDLRLVAVDPLSRFYGADENDNTASTFFCSLLEEMKERSNATVLCVHHMSKSAGGKGDKFDLEAWLDQGAMRGASGLTGAARWQMNVVTLPDKQAAKYGYAGDSQVIALRVCKKNYGPPEDTFFFQRGRGGVLSRFEAGATPAAVDAQAQLVERVVGVVREREDAGRPITQKQLREVYCGKWKDLLGCSKTAIGAAVNEAILDEVVYESTENNPSGLKTKYLRINPASDPADPASDPAKHRPGQPGQPGQKHPAGLKHHRIIDFSQPGQNQPGQENPKASRVPYSLTRPTRPTRPSKEGDDCRLQAACPPLSESEAGQNSSHSHMADSQEIDAALEPEIDDDIEVF